MSLMLLNNGVSAPSRDRVFNSPTDVGSNDYSLTRPSSLDIKGQKSKKKANFKTLPPSAILPPIVPIAPPPHIPLTEFGPPPTRGMVNNPLLQHGEPTRGGSGRALSPKIANRIKASNLL